VGNGQFVQYPVQVSAGVRQRGRGYTNGDGSHDPVFECAWDGSRSFPGLHLQALAGDEGGARDVDFYVPLDLGLAGKPVASCQRIIRQEALLDQAGEGKLADLVADDHPALPAGAPAATFGG
jgi:hypothetical protein